MSDRAVIHMNGLTVANSFSRPMLENIFFWALYVSEGHKPFVKGMIA